MLLIGERLLRERQEGRKNVRQSLRVDMQDKGEELRYLREYLYQVPSAPAAPGA